jgi:hypothetical protein
VASRLLGYLEQLAAREAAAAPAVTLLEPLSVPIAVFGSVVALGLSGLVGFGFDEWGHWPLNARLSDGLVSCLVALLGWAMGLLLLRGWLGWKRPSPVVVVHAYCTHCAGSVPAIAGEGFACPLSARR